MTAPQGPDARRAATRSATTPAGKPPPPAAPAGRPAAAQTGTPASAATQPGTPTTVLPGAGSRRPPPRASVPRSSESTASRPASRARRARLALKRVDPWSVFVFTLLASVFLGIAVVVAVAALYAVMDGLGVVSSLNDLIGEVTADDDGTPEALITAGRVVGGAAVLAAANVVLLTLLTTLGALLYNLCASFTGGIEVTLGERDG